MTYYYFGDKYYNKSGTRMGILYSETGQRYDWGFIQRDLSQGKEVTIKPATREMLDWADKQLSQY